LVYRTFFCCENTIRFLRARDAWEQHGDPDARAEMQRLAACERDNARASLPIYAAAPWLDLAERTDGRFSPCADMLAEKIRLLEAMPAV